MNNLSEKENKFGIKYCTACGAAIPPIVRLTSYNRDTGEPYYTYDYRCPNSGLLKIFSSHAYFSISEDPSDVIDFYAG
jgi:predicted RNA-binding Zn-ribbon protein involved in translation (DUF1610 family)